MVTIDCIGDRIALRGAYDIKEHLKELSGARWNFPKGCLAWTFPLTPAAAASVWALLSNINEPYQLGNYSTKYVECLSQALSRQESVKFKRADFDLPPFPLASKTFIPRRSQLAAFHFAKDCKTALLWMPMGHGKSRVAIDLIEYRKHNRILIICTKAAVESVWPEQLETHANFEYVLSANRSGTIEHRLEDAVYKSQIAERRGVPFILVVNHSSFWREPMATWIKSLAKFDFLIVDECHKAASASSKISKFLEKLKIIEFRLGLSGTALQDKPIDAFGVYRFLDAGIFGDSVSRFQERYCRMGGYKNKQFLDLKPSMRDEFVGKIASIAFIADESGIDLPPTRCIDRKFTLSPAVRAIYDELEEELITEIRGQEVIIQNVLVKATKLHQIANGYLKNDEVNLHVHDEKVDILEDILLSLDATEPMPIFYKFKNDVIGIKQACDRVGRSCGELNGQRDQLAEWKSGKLNVLAIQIASGSNSIDLTRACYFAYYSLTFSLVEWLQSQKRVHRPPQKRNVTYYRILAKGTIDIKIAATLLRKEEVIDLIIREGLALND